MLMNTSPSPHVWSCLILIPACTQSQKSFPICFIKKHKLVIYNTIAVFDFPNTRN